MVQLIADIILMIHTLYVAFVVLGLVLIFVGRFLGWSWVRNVWFRIAHLGAIGVVVAEGWLGQDCPLTLWENRLREAAGGISYSETFLQHWLQKIIFYDFPAWVFTLAYTAFAGLVVLAWVWVPPAWPPKRRRA